MQDGPLPDKLRVREALDLYASFYQRPANADELITRLGLSDRRNTPFGKLSGGQKQRLSVALALIGTPRVAVLDELTTGLDPAARREVWGLISEIRNTGVTVVLVTHFMEEAERLCDRVALIDAGRVIATDTPSGLASRAGGDQQIRFRASAPLDEGLLAKLPEVSSAHREGDQFTVTGNEDALQAVIIVLIRHGIIAQHLRVDQANLDDAFVALTSRGRSPAGPRPAPAQRKHEGDNRHVMTGVQFLPATLAGYRERGILRRMFTTPVTPRALLAAQLALLLGVQIATAAVIVLLATGAFSASIGQPVAFIVAFVLMAAAASTLGLLVAAVSFTSKAAGTIGGVPTCGPSPCTGRAGSPGPPGHAPA